MSAPADIAPPVVAQVLMGGYAMRNRYVLFADVIRTVHPDVVFHAAAHKHLPLMEDNVEEAISNNVLGTRNIVEAAAAVGTTRLVLISTDKAVAPSSLMGPPGGSPR